MSHPERSSALPVSTVGSDALVLATICEQLRVEMTRPAYARLGLDADPLAPTLESLRALRAAPESPEAATLLLASLTQIIEIAQRMRAVSDDVRLTLPVNSAPSLDSFGLGETAARSIDAFLSAAKAKYTQLRDLQEEPSPMTVHMRESHLE